MEYFKNIFEKDRIDWILRLLHTSFKPQIVNHIHIIVNHSENSFIKFEILAFSTFSLSVNFSFTSFLWNAKCW